MAAPRPTGAGLNSKEIEDLAAQRASRWGTSTGSALAISRAMADADAPAKAKAAAAERAAAQEAVAAAGRKEPEPERDMEAMWAEHQRKMRGVKREHQLYRTSGKVIASKQDDKALCDAGKKNVRASGFSEWCQRGQGAKNTSLETGVYKSRALKMHDGVWRPLGNV